MKIILLLLSLTSATSIMASDLPVSIVKASLSEKAALEIALNHVSSLLPAKFKAGLPQNIQVKVEKLSDQQGIPQSICDVQKLDNNKSKSFIYGDYNQRTNSLVINSAVVNELMKDPSYSTKINCQHKSLYDQAISTIIHELAHAYDFHGHNISSSAEFYERAGFKRGLLKIKNKNVEAMRPADPYELQSAVESFAVNMEYFSMDPEFACRRPAMYEYFKNIFGEDTVLQRSCTINRTVLMSTNAGLIPIRLDPSRVFRIDYLMASPGKDLSSGFGHSMFRIVMCAPEHFDPITNKMVPATPFGKQCLDDKLFHLVVSYRANVEDATLNYLKGLTGGYPSMMFILNFSDVLDEYNRDELRDVVSYPLRLSAQEKLDILNKILEDHWNYRGQYKFITNNCAVESYNLLKSSLDRSQLNNYHSLTPNGVLEDLDRMEFLSLKNGDQEVFKARTDQLQLAYVLAYGYKSKGIKKDKDALLQFVSNSKVEYRKTTFETFRSSKYPEQNLHDQMVTMKSHLVKLSSFSVLEQQILRTKTADFRKKAADYFANSKDEKIQELIKESGAKLKQSYADFSTGGYGVPLDSEMISKNDIDQKLSLSKEVVANIETAVKEKMPEELAILESINANILLFNQESLAYRKLYREKLDIYISQVLKNLSLEDQGRSLLISSLTSKNDLDKVRELLDPSLVGQNEILDSKLRKIITETLGS